MRQELKTDQEIAMSSETGPANISQAPAASHKSQVRRHCLLRVFHALNILTVAVAGMVGIAEILSLVFQQRHKIASTVLQAYALFFCIVIVLSELEWTKPVRESPLVRNWFWRGIFYVFVGCLVYEQIPDTPGNMTDVQKAYIETVSILLMVIGAMYGAMGIVLIKRWRDSLQTKYHTMLSHAEMADALQQQQQPSSRA